MASATQQSEEKHSTEASELKGKKAVIYLSVMLVTYVVCAFLISCSGNANIPETNKSLAGSLFSGAAAAWAISKVLPDGVITTSRAWWLALAVNSVAAAAVLYVVI